MSDLSDNPAPTTTLPTQSDPISEIRAELGHLREKFTAIEEIDRQTSDMVTRLADVVRSSAEIRAKASLDIAAGIRRCEEMLESQVGQQRQVMSNLLTDIEAARERVLGLTGFAAALEGHVAGIQQRIVTSAGEIPPAPVPQPVATPAAPIEPEAPLLSTWVEIEAVPSAAAALSLQRHAGAIPGVTTAITRAFGGGIIRMEVKAARRLGPADFEPWPDGELGTVEETSELLRMRILPKASPAD